MENALPLQFQFTHSPASPLFVVVLVLLAMSFPLLFIITMLLMRQGLPGKFRVKTLEVITNFIGLMTNTKIFIPGGARQFIYCIIIYKLGCA